MNAEKANNQAYERFLTNKAKKNGYFVPQTVRLSPEPLHDYIDAFIENIDRNDPSQYSVQWRAPVQQRTAADSSGPGPGSTTDSADGIASGMAMRGVVIAPPEGMRGEPCEWWGRVLGKSSRTGR